MTEIQQNRYDRLVRRVNNIVAPGSMVGDALSELFPTLDVENVPGELLVLADTRVCFGGADIGGVALNVSRLQLFNPVGSNMLLTISKVYFTTGGTLTARWGIREDLPLVTNTNDGVFRETRLGIVPRPVGQIRTQNNNPTLAPGNGFVRTLPNTVIYLEDPNGIAVLSPGFGWEISGNAVNTQFTGTIYWRERVAEPSELNL